MSINTAPLSDAERAALRGLATPRGARAAGVLLGVPRESVTRALAGLNLRKGTLALLHAALAPHLPASKANASRAAQQPVEGPRAA